MCFQTELTPSVTIIMMLSVSTNRSLVHTLIVIFSTPHEMSSSLANPQIILKCQNRLLNAGWLLSATIAATIWQTASSSWRGKPPPPAEFLGLTLYWSLSYLTRDLSFDIVLHAQCILELLSGPPVINGGHSANVSLGYITGRCHEDEWRHRSELISFRTRIDSRWEGQKEDSSTHVTVSA